jgi:hypothetical protein
VTQVVNPLEYEPQKGVTVSVGYSTVEVQLGLNGGGPAAVFAPRKGQGERPDGVGSDEPSWQRVAASSSCA